MGKIYRDLLRASGDDIGNDRVAFSRPQACAMRHFIDEFGPLLGLIMPDWRKGVALDATVHKKCPALFPHYNIDMFSLPGRHLRGDRWWWRNNYRFAAREHAHDRHDED